MKRFILLVVLGAAVFATAASPASAVTRWVNDDDPNGPPYIPPGTSCSDPGFSSIEAAVNVSGPSDTVLVCPGTYPEIVTVDPGKNNLTVRSTTPLAAVIQAPVTIAADLVNSKSIVRVTTSTNVTIQAFTIRGPGPGPCDSIRYGVRVDGNGSANVLFNDILDIRDQPLGGCQNGVGIQVGRQFEGQVGSALIVGNRLERYQKNGMTIDNAGSTAVVRSNLVQGIGPTPIIAQNGIQISRGAVAEARFNRLFDHSYSLAPATGSTGFLLFEAGAGVRIIDNEAARNDDNLAAYTTSGALIDDNRFTDSTFFDGIYMSVDSSNNRIENNFLRGNAEHDCHDDSFGGGTAGTANFWINNDGETQNRPGLCRAGDGDDDDDDGGDDDDGDGDDGGGGGDDDDDDRHDADD